MIITLSGITGTGKSFFKNAIVKELGFENLVIITTREKRENEVNGIDKNFVTDKEFEQLKEEKKVLVDFEFLDAKYAYKRENLESNQNQVTEVHYNTIYKFKKYAKDVFSVYIIPSDFERAKQELKNRKLQKSIEEKRLVEMQEQVKEFSINKELQSQFDYVFTNDYTEESKNELLEVINKRIGNK